ncbi:PepSY domain-containing protein, partial [Xanthomonas sp. Kuri4-3]
MKQGFRQSMAWLHTWTGLLVGWLLLLIFMGGTASYYRDEITRWMRPELPTTPVSAEVALRSAERYLQAHAPDAQNWNITLPDERNPVLVMYWLNPAPPAGQPPASRREMYGNATLDPATGDDVAARETRGGDFFYRLHFDLHYLPAIWARYIVGFCAMFMLVAIISGVITHKKIFKDFFTFRPGKGQRSWLDFHNVSAVLALPYHAMITYTGIVTLMFMYLPWGIKAAYPDDEMRFYDEAANRVADTRPAAGTPATLLPLEQLVQR